ncbi:MAG: DUF4188 domain-containing protein [Hyphomicrobiales bacterium]
MAPVFPGRYTAVAEGPFVVFLIGMRINRPWRVDLWWPAFRAMPRMLRELTKARELGLLSHELMLFRTGFSVVQYWRSFEALEAYAWARNHEHFPAQKAFNAAVGDNPAVGVWHETYVVEPGRHEAIYRNMPRFGLARAFEHRLIDAPRDRARGRMGASS